MQNRNKIKNNTRNNSRKLTEKSTPYLREDLYNTQNILFLDDPIGLEGIFIYTSFMS